jgi:hypothetical protein
MVVEFSTFDSRDTFAGKLAGDSHALLDNSNLSSYSSRTMQIPDFSLEPSQPLEKAGFRFGRKGTHTCRTMMLSELSDLFSDLPVSAGRADYADAIIEDNVLGKQTTASRRLTNQRLGELYGLDRSLPLFRVLRYLWDIDPDGRPLMALLCTLARDPLLRVTAPTILDLPEGYDLVRGTLLATIRDAAGARLNESTIDKVARNVGSTWTQSGHLAGRVRKIRQRVAPTVGPSAYALWLGSLEGLAGEQLLECRWVSVLDRSGREMVELALRAKQLGLIHARIGGGVVEIDASRLETTARGH